MTDGCFLIVDAPSIVVRSGGPATGTIIVRLGDVLFPTDDWNDFVLVVLEGWVSALQRLASRATNSERVFLMDGPYCVDIARLTTGQFRLRAVERPNRERACIDVMPLALVKDAIRAADAVLSCCRKAGDDSADLARLERSLRALRLQATGLEN